MNSKSPNKPIAELAVIPKTEWPRPASSDNLQEGLVKF